MYLAFSFFGKPKMLDFKTSAVVLLLGKAT